MKVGYILLCAFFVYAVWDSVSKNSETDFKSKRLECHANSTVFEGVIKESLLHQLQSKIKSVDENIKVSISTRKSKYMPSKLFEHVKVDKVKNEFETLLQNKISKPYGNIAIEVIIHENDKDDPNKKNPKSKLFAGYIEFHYSYKNERVYMVQIDFFNEKGKDISQVLQCGLQSVKTIK
jgi:hypothetical protein